ncbi:MAG: peptidoglycan editing factor PgeF [Anaerolineales bacterium]|nr:MAG: peptidoglycan editing factor PgeF [Anaerolineales bacterium]
MPFQQFDSIRYFNFNSLRDEGVVHAVFSRQGGVSPDPWAALNVGGTVGDRTERVAENKLRAMKAIGRSIDSIYDVWQVHSSDVVIAEYPRLSNQPPVKADAILTDRVGVNLFMRFADCVPILLYEPVKKVVGIVHAGWQGTVNRTVRSAIQAMQDEFRVKANDIMAAIGPSIGAHHYEIGFDLVAKVQHVFGSDSTGLLGNYQGKSKGSGIQLDLWEANRLILEQSGVRQIEFSGICTACHLEDWYSYRGEAGHTGRFGVMIGLK